MTIKVFAHTREKLANSVDALAPLCQGSAGKETHRPRNENSSGDGGTHRSGCAGYGSDAATPVPQQSVIRLTAPTRVRHPNRSDATYRPRRW